VVLIVAFWAAGAVLAWVYAGYPLAAAVLARLAPQRLRQSTPQPTVSVAIAVHDEEAHVADRIADLLAQEASGAELLEVIVGSDGSIDRTDDIVREIARSEPRVRLVALPRSGTTPTQHALFEAATGDVVLLTDAETRFAPGCIAALAAVFRDPTVGCATGRLEWLGEDATATSRNEGAYWRYERLVRTLESRAGLLTVGTGAILAVRRSSYRAVRSTTGMDHLVPLIVLGQGQRMVLVPEAIGYDRPISGLREQFRNRTRTATRGIGANLSMVGALAPWLHPRAALAIWSHKLLRWATPWLVLVVVASGAALAASGQTLYAVVPIGAVAAIGLAAIAHLMTRRGIRPPRIAAFCRAFAVVNLAFAIAWVNVASGRTIEAWHRADWDTGSPVSRS
jgi:cellulose synthase/poly-beta-1,6-N-acetylglucosamine synthase-like glycosyltransferase